MNRSEYKRATVAAEDLHGAVSLVDADLLLGIVARVASSTGVVLKTPEIGEAFDCPGGRRMI